jgi:hypothetical protein
MAADRDNGLAWPKIAEKYGVSQSTAQRAVRRRLAEQAEESPGAPAPDALDRFGMQIDPVAEIIDLIRTRERIAEKLEGIADNGSHPGYQVSALARLNEVKTARFALLQAVGLVPRRLSWWTEEAGMVRMLRDFAELIRKHDVPDEVLNDFQQLAESRVEQSRGVSLALTGGGTS